MRLNWDHWTYDLFASVIKAMAVTLGVWGFYTIKYQDLVWSDLWQACLVAALLRGLMPFLEKRPLPEQNDVPPPKA